MSATTVFLLIGKLGRGIVPPVRGPFRVINRIVTLPGAKESYYVTGGSKQTVIAIPGIIEAATIAENEV